MVDNQRGNCTLEVYSPKHLVCHSKLFEKTRVSRWLLLDGKPYSSPRPLSNVAPAIIFEVTTTHEHFKK